MYGKSILADVINKTLQDKLFGYLDEEKINYLGQPLPDEDKNNITSLDINHPSDYTFSFELGLSLLMLSSKALQLRIPTLFMMSDIADHLVDEELSCSQKASWARG
jgi:trigger factor